MPKTAKTTKAIEPKVDICTDEFVQDTKALIMLPYRIRRADTNNIVIEKLKKRTQSDDTYWDVEGYYNNFVNACVKLFYKDISSDNIESIKELVQVVKSTESKILKAIQDFKI